MQIKHLRGVLEYIDALRVEWIRKLIRVPTMSSIVREFGKTYYEAIYEGFHVFIIEKMKHKLTRLM